MYTCKLFEDYEVARGTMYFNTRKHARGFEHFT